MVNTNYAAILNDLVGAEEAAQLAGMSLRNFYRLIESNQVAAKKLGEGRTAPIVVIKSSVQDYLKRKKRSQSDN